VKLMPIEEGCLAVIIKSGKDPRNIHIGGSVVRVGVCVGDAPKSANGDYFFANGVPMWEIDMPVFFDYGEQPDHLMGEPCLMRIDGLKEDQSLEQGVEYETQDS